MESMSYTIRNPQQEDWQVSRVSLCTLQSHYQIRQANH